MNRLQSDLAVRERWSANAGTSDVATLDIPADAGRDRRFDIDCRFVVQMRAGADAAWHAMKVYAGGSLEWSRRIATSNPGSTDSLDYHFRVDLPSGHALRVVAATETHGVSRVGLVIEAEEN